VIREVEPQVLIAAAARFGAQVEAQSVEAQFIPYPEKWLNDGRWEDEQSVSVPQPIAPTDWDAYRADEDARIEAWRAQDEDDAEPPAPPEPEHLDESEIPGEVRALVDGIGS
jgi:hypothetical protein